jgi:hypothetical protein
MMSKDADQKTRDSALLHVDGFEGELRAEKHSAPMRWSVTIGRHGGIALTFEATTLAAENKWLFEAAFPDGPLLRPLSINGKTPDGVTCSTDSLYVVNYSHATDEQGNRLTIGGDASNLRLLYKELPKSPEGLRIIYFTVGMRAFGAPARRYDCRENKSRWTLSTGTTRRHRGPSYYCSSSRRPSF